MPVARTIAQVIAGEAVRGTPEQRLQDMIGIASVIQNRAAQLKVTPEEVVSVQTQFNAYGKKMPAGTAKLVGLAEQALGYVAENGPIHGATFYATPTATKNLPKGLQAIAETTGHRYFTDPKARAIQTAVGNRRPNVSAPLPKTGPVPTAAPRGLLASTAPAGLLGASSPAAKVAGLLGADVPALQMSARPVPGVTRLADPYGMRTHPITGRQKLHTGMDFAKAPGRTIKGQPALSTAEGTVVSAGKRGGYGNRVEVDHGNGVVTSYSHLGSIGVKVGDAVRAGQPIGKVGSTGFSTGDHLHFEMSVNGKKVDPASYVDKAGIRPVDAEAQAANRPVATAKDARAPATARVATGSLLDAATVAPSVGLRATAAPRGLLDGAASLSPVQTAPRTLSPVKNAPTPARIANTAKVATTSAPTPKTVIGMDVTGGLADKGRRVTTDTPVSGPLSQRQAANLAERLDAAAPKVTAAPALAARSMTPVASVAKAVQTAAKPATMTPVGLLGASTLSPVQATATSLSPVQNATRALAATPAVAKTLSPVSDVAKSLSPVPNAAQPARVASTSLVDTAGMTPAQIDASVKAALTASPNTPKYAAENPAAAPAASLPALAPAVSVPSRKVASAREAVPAAVAAAQPAPAKAVSTSTGLGLPGVPDAPGFGAQMASQIGNSFSQNKGRMVGGLLGNVVAGPVGGLLGGYLGNRIQQNNTPQMSAAARDAIEAGMFDGFSQGPARNRAGFGALSAGADPRMSDRARAASAMGFDGFSHQTGVLGAAGNLAARISGLLGVGRSDNADPRMSNAARIATNFGGFDGFSHNRGVIGLGENLGRAIGGLLGSNTSSAGRSGPATGGGLLGGLGGFFGGGGSTSGGIGPNGSGPRDPSGSGSGNRNTTGSNQNTSSKSGSSKSGGKKK